MKGIKLINPRLKSVAECISRGLSNKEVATELGIAETAAKQYSSVLLATLSLTSRLEIGLWASSHKDELK